VAPYPDRDELLADATAQTGLSDFGPGDFREGLDMLLASLTADADLSPASAASVTADLRRRLVNRLEVEGWYRDHPEVEDVAVRGPVDINGLPRTGTTALASMLSLDPQFRCLRRWEQVRPCPPPRVEDEPTDPRRVASAGEIDAMRAAMREKHIFELDATTEDTELLGMAFHGQQFTVPVYRYHAWWRSCDMRSAFHYHRRVVKLLGSRRPPDRWLFKAPHHNFHLEAFVAAYPEARFVMTHRDPAKAVPSWASMVSSILPAAAGDRDVERLGAEVAAHLLAGVDQAMSARARLDADRFLDVHHRQLVSDPKGTVRRIYRFLDLELTPSVEQAILDWQAANRVGAHGTHRYTAEQFGLTTARLRSDFAAYIRHFDIDLEG
jgi:sulfotransferase family protein